MDIQLLDRDKAKKALDDGFCVIFGEKHRAFLEKTGDELIELGKENAVEWCHYLLFYKIDRLGFQFEMAEKGIIKEEQINSLVKNLKVFFTDEEIEKLSCNEIDSSKLPSTLLISAAQNKEIPKKDFVKILVGNLHKWSSKWKFNLDCYGILDNFKNQEVVLDEILKSLIEKELISEEMDSSLRITKKGIRHISEGESVSEGLIVEGDHSAPWILGEKKNPEDIPKLIDFTKSDNTNERRLAASALGKMAKLKPQIYEAVPSLILLLKDEKPQVRQYAIKSLGLIKDKRAQPHLEIIAEDDEKEYNRKCAEKAVKKLT